MSTTNTTTTKALATSDRRAQLSLIACDDDRLQAAQEAVMRGYQEAVDILSPGPGVPRHARHDWFAAGLADARELAGLPRARVLGDAAQH